MRRVLLSLMAVLGLMAVSCKKPFVELESITFAEDYPEVEVGKTKTLKVNFFPENATDKKLTWSHTEFLESVATVDQNGKVTAHSEGTTVITVKSSNDLYAACFLKVVDNSPKPVTGISLNVKRQSLYKDEVKTLTATVSPSTAANKTVNWTVDNTRVVDIEPNDDGTCQIKGKKDGYAILTATTEEGNKVATCIISVMNDGSQFSKDVKSSFYLPTRHIQKGSFNMGSPASDSQAQAEEKPQHQVTFSRNFYLSYFEITNYQFAVFLNDKKIPESGKDTNGNLLVKRVSSGMKFNTETSKWEPVTAGYAHYPAVGVSYYGATAFAEWAGGRLPTEAEWEYACRAGTTTIYPWGDSSTGLSDYVWYRGNSNTNMKEVGTKKPNAWGLYDMLGNAYEWCYDRYAAYSAGNQTDPQGPTSGYGRVQRGGSVGGYSSDCRPAARGYNSDDFVGDFMGFRVAFTN